MKKLFEKVISQDEEGCSYKLLRVGGIPQETFRCDCYHCQADRDCCGNFFCSSVKSYLFGLITVGLYLRNV